VFLNSEELNYKYAPVISIKVAEIQAVKQLPDKAKDILLPIIPLRGWGGSKFLNNSLEKIQEAFGSRKVIIDLDSEYLQKCTLAIEDVSCREVFKELIDLSNPLNGYKAWCDFIGKNELYIPVVQLKDLNNLRGQILRLADLDRGMVLRFHSEDFANPYHQDVLRTISNIGYKDIFVIYEFGQVNREILDSVAEISNLIEITKQHLGDVLIAVSCSSFPFSFSGHSEADFSIIERLLYTKIKARVENSRLIYADWASARADSIEEGGRIPPPRIDYPLRDEWRIFREDFEDFRDIQDGEKKSIYIKLARSVVNSDCWDSNLHTWGTQRIELTSLGDSFGIDTPQKAAAVRINIHLHRQLYYDAPGSLVDLDEEWVD